MQQLRITEVIVTGRCGKLWLCLSGTVCVICAAIHALLLHLSKCLFASSQKSHSSRAVCRQRDCQSACLPARPVLALSGASLLAAVCACWAFSARSPRSKPGDMAEQAEHPHTAASNVCMTQEDQKPSFCGSPAKQPLV